MLPSLWQSDDTVFCSHTQTASMGLVCRRASQFGLSHAESERGCFLRVCANSITADDANGTPPDNFFSPWWRHSFTTAAHSALGCIELHRLLSNHAQSHLCKLHCRGSLHNHVCAMRIFGESGWAAAVADYRRWWAAFHLKSRYILWAETLYEKQFWRCI